MDDGLVVAIRSVIAFLTLLIYVRVLGKRQVSQLSAFDWVFGITIGNIAGGLASDLSVRAWDYWVALTVMSALAIILQLVTLKSRQLAKYIDGEPIVVMMNGKIMEGALEVERLRFGGFLSQLRTKGIFDLSDVEFAVLEAGGNVAVLKKSQAQPVTPKDLKLSTAYKGMSTELIYDGLILDRNLKQINLDRAWLEGELRKQGIHDPSEVFRAEINTSGELYVDKYRDRIATPVDPSDYPNSPL